MKLITLRIYCAQIDAKIACGMTHKEGFALIMNYVRLLVEPLTLGMFVPCDLEGNVLRHPIKPLSTDTMPHQWLLDQWVEAKGRVIFEGWRARIMLDKNVFLKHINQMGSYSQNLIEENNVEWLTTKHKEFVLTPQAVERYKI